MRPLCFSLSLALITHSGEYIRDEELAIDDESTLRFKSEAASELVDKLRDYRDEMVAPMTRAQFFAGIDTSDVDILRQRCVLGACGECE